MNDKPDLIITLEGPAVKQGIPIPFFVDIAEAVLKRLGRDAEAGPMEPGTNRLTFYRKRGKE